MKLFRILAAGLTGLALIAGSAHAEGGAKHAATPEQGWSFEGVFGKVDKASVQRGYQVYQEVCSSCHGMKLMAYRNLGEPHGPFFDPEYPNANDNPVIKAFAAANEIAALDSNGDIEYVQAKPADVFREPYPNVIAAAAANNGAAPPDLSLMSKARHNGPNYIYRLLSGYPSEDAISQRVVSEFDDNGTPDDLTDDTPRVTQTIIDVDKMHLDDHGDGHGDKDSHHYAPLIQPAGQYYNPYFPGDTTPQYEGDPRHPPAGGFLAMAPQLRDGMIEYTDGTEATIDQMAYDVANFLAWSGDPKMDNRKSLGLSVMLYLFILAILLWFSYKQIWRNVDH